MNKDFRTSVDTMHHCNVKLFLMSNTFFTFCPSICDLPSIISISPALGQFGPQVQKAGHVPQPVGICSKSIIIMAPVNVA